MTPDPHARSGGPAPVAGLRTGSFVGGYRLLRRLGAGGMGVVWEAADGEGRRVAMKILHPQVAADPVARERLEREARVLARVRDPRVARVLDIETGGPGSEPDGSDGSDGLTFVVTELVDGPTLQHEVDHEGPYDLAVDARDLADLAHGLVGALGAVHAAGVIHRDLKPSNVMLGSEGPVLIDFGIAQVADDVRLTQTGLVTGTPGFLPTEMLDGGEPGPEGDWFALAGVLLFAVTGRPPFGSGPWQAVFRRVYAGTPDLGELPTACPALARALDAALAPELGDRLPASALLDVLDEVADGGTGELAVERHLGPVPGPAAAGPVASDGPTGTTAWPSAGTDPSAWDAAGPTAEGASAPDDASVGSASAADASELPPSFLPPGAWSAAPEPESDGAAATWQDPWAPAAASQPGPDGASAPWQDPWAPAASPQPSSSGGEEPWRDPWTSAASGSPSGTAAGAAEPATVVGPAPWWTDAWPPSGTGQAPPSYPPVPTGAESWQPGAPAWPAPGTAGDVTPGAADPYRQVQPAGAGPEPGALPDWAREPRRHRGVIAAAFLALVALATFLPGWAAVAAAGLALLSGTVGRADDARRWRRLQSGRATASDTSRMWLASPWYLLRSAIATALACVVAGGVALGTHYVAGVLVARGDPLAGGAATALAEYHRTGVLAAGAVAVFLILLWFIPWGGPMRRGGSRLSDAVLGGPGSVLAGIVLLAAAVALAVLFVLGSLPVLTTAPLPF